MVDELQNFVIIQLYMHAGLLAGGSMQRACKHMDKRVDPSCMDTWKKPQSWQADPSLAHSSGDDRGSSNLRRSMIGIAEALSATTFSRSQSQRRR